jgi:hypothetical protein
MHQNLTQPQHARRTFAVPIDFAYDLILPKNHSISSCSDFLSAIPAVPHSEAHFPRRRPHIANVRSERHYHAFLLIFRQQFRTLYQIFRRNKYQIRTPQNLTHNRHQYPFHLFLPHNVTVPKQRRPAFIPGKKQVRKLHKCVFAKHK